MIDNKVVYVRSDLLIFVCFIYLNAVRGLSSLTDEHGKKIMKKLMEHI